jgi:prepilin-type N-terminal cleavage/methylation domain-containing protein
MKSRRPVPPSAYTLVEVLVALSIIALAIGAASRLSLGQALTEEINQKESFAVNYAENAARLWQLGIDNPGPLLLQSLNTDGSLMTLTIDSNLATTAIDVPGTVSAGDDGSTADRFAIVVQRTNCRVNWLPPGKSTTTPLDYPVLRQVQPRR